MELVEVLAASYAKLLGEPLVPEDVPPAERADWLYHAPFGLLAHNTSPDPVFVYANLTAQKHFGYSWDEFVGLPSRLSAGIEDRESRQAVLADVRRQGYTNGYRGLRVTKTGQSFWIENVTIWNLFDSASSPVGQAALIEGWRCAEVTAGEHCGAGCSN